MMVHATPELIVLARLAADLMDWIDCSWIIGLMGAGRDIQVACVMGTPPDVSRCVECVKDSVRVPAMIECTGSSSIATLLARISLGRGGDGIEPMLAIGPKNGGRVYSLRDRELVRDLCLAIGDVLRNARSAEVISPECIESDRIRADFEAVQELQDRFLPRFTPCDAAPVRGLEYYGSSQRCGALGGDFFGFLNPQPAQLVMTIGRVAPAGSPAALLAAGLQAKLRTLVEYVGDLPRVMEELNRMMWEVSPGDVFSNLLCARVDPSQHRLEYVCAGQEAAFVVRASNLRIEPLENCGAVLGLSRRSNYFKRTIALDPGDVLVAVTDGVADASAPGDMHFIEALPNLLRELSRVRVRDLASSVLDAVERFTGRPAEVADRTATVIRMNDRARKSVDEIRTPSYYVSAMAA